MAKMKNCKYCGAEIAKNAKTCPSCGAKQKKPTALIIALIIAVIIIISLTSGNSSGAKKVGEAGTQNSVAPQTQAPSKDIFQVGDIVELDDIKVTLVGVTESNGENYLVAPEEGNVFILCEFNIENNSTEDIAVSSLLSFEAYVDDYTTNLSLTAIASANKTQLDGTVAAGKKMNGVIGYEAAADWKSIEVRFTPSFWTGKEIAFEYSK